jgi:ferrous iron transport protein A
MLQLSGNKVQAEAVVGNLVQTSLVQTSLVETSLVDLRKGDAAVLDYIDLPGDEARRLMELGFLPGIRITAGLSAPGGDPRVFQVDGSEIALRRETAKLLKVTLDRKPGKSKIPRVL